MGSGGASFSPYRLQDVLEGYPRTSGVACFVPKIYCSCVLNLFPFRVIGNHSLLWEEVLKGIVRDMGYDRPTALMTSGSFSKSAFLCWAGQPCQLQTVCFVLQNLLLFLRSLVTESWHLNI